MDKLSYQLGQIDGQLIAFALLNSKLNHEFTYELTPLPAGTSAEQAVQQCLSAYYEHASFEYLPLPNWHAELSQQLHEWLFSFQPQLNAAEQQQWGGCGSAFAYLKDVDHSFTLYDADARATLVNQLCQDIDNAIQIKQLISVKMQSQAWYEASWCDFILEGEHATLFLHFGVSD